jgi:hypothetical protein
VRDPIRGPLCDRGLPTTPSKKWLARSVAQCRVEQGAETSVARSERSDGVPQPPRLFLELETVTRLPAA